MRIEWSPDGARLLANHRVLDLAGAVLVEIAADMPVLDARWVDGGITTIDRGHRQDWWDLDGRRVKRVDFGDAGALAAQARMSARGRRVVRDDGTPVVTEADRVPRFVWSHPSGSPTMDVEISECGTRVVVADRAYVEGDRPGVGWIAYDVDTGTELYEDSVPTERLRFAFDASGKRMAYAGPAPMGPIGVVELGGRELLAYPEYMAGADAVALDPQGVIAAFASPGRIRFDDLASGSTLALALDRAPIAVAFSPDSRMLAYLAADDSVGIVPVP